MAHVAMRSHAVACQLPCVAAHRPIGRLLMARNEARLSVAIWSDRDFLALPASAQRQFMFLVSQPDLAHDGVLALRERRWSKSAAGLTVEQIRDDLAALSAARFIVIDEDAEELLIRSFIRRDKVYRQPNVLRSAADHLKTVGSARILAAVAVELARIEAEADDIPEGSRDVLAAMRKAIGEPLPEPFGEPFPEGLVSSDQHVTRSDNPSAGGTPEPLVEPFPEPFGEDIQATSAKSHGERGVVTAVGRDSPNPYPRSTDPVPRGGASRPPRARTRERATRLPDDFTLTEEMAEWGREHAPHVDGRYETEKFIDYWRGRSGKDGVKLDWIATWRNWIRKAAERGGRPPGAAIPRSVTDDRVDHTLELGRQMQAEFDAQGGQKELTP